MPIFGEYLHRKIPQLNLNFKQLWNNQGSNNCVKAKSFILLLLIKSNSQKQRFSLPKIIIIHFRTNEDHLQANVCKCIALTVLLQTER